MGPATGANPLTGFALDLQLYESNWDEPKVLVCATTPAGEWSCILALHPFEQALDEAGQGVVSDLGLAGAEGVVRPADNGLEVELGPFVVAGRREDWQLMLERERADTLPLSQLPHIAFVAWDGDRTPFPVTSSD